MKLYNLQQATKGPKTGLAILLLKLRQLCRRLTTGPQDEHLYPATLDEREREYKIRLAAFLAGHQPKIRVIKA